MRISHQSQQQLQTKTKRANNVEPQTVITTSRKINLSSDSLDLYTHYLVKNPTSLSIIELQDISQMLRVQKSSFFNNPYAPYLLERAHELNYNS